MCRSISLSFLVILLLLTACGNNADDKPVLESSRGDEVATSIQSEADGFVKSNTDNIPALHGKLIYVSDQTLYEMTADVTTPKILAENVGFVTRSPQYNQILYLTDLEPPTLALLNLDVDSPEIILELKANEIVANYQWSPSGEWLFIRTSDTENSRCMVWHTSDETNVVQAVDREPQSNIETTCLGLWLTDDNMLFRSTYESPENMIWIYSPTTNEWTELDTYTQFDFFFTPYNNAFQKYARAALEEFGIGTLARPTTSFWSVVSENQDFYYEAIATGNSPCDDIELVQKPLLKMVLPTTIFKSLKTTNVSQIILLPHGKLTFLRFLPTACAIENGTIQLIAVDPNTPNEFEILAEMKDAAFSPIITARLDLSPDGEYLVWSYESADFATSNLMLTTLADNTTVKLLDVKLTYDGDFMIPELITHVFWVNE